MRNSEQQIGEGRYVELKDGSFLLRQRDRERLNDRVAWMGQAERGRILEEAWFEGPEVYERLDDTVIIDTNEGDGEGEVIYEDTIDFAALEERVGAVLEAVRFEGMRNKIGNLVDECIGETLAIVDELRGLVRKHARAFIIAGGVATGAAATWTALNSDPVSVAHAAEDSSSPESCEGH